MIRRGQHPEGRGCKLLLLSWRYPARPKKSFPNPHPPHRPMANHSWQVTCQLTVLSWTLSPFCAMDFQGSFLYSHLCFVFLGESSDLRWPLMSCLLLSPGCELSGCVGWHHASPSPPVCITPLPQDRSNLLPVPVYLRFPRTQRRNRNQVCECVFSSFTSRKNIKKSPRIDGNLMNTYWSSPVSSCE